MSRQLAVNFRRTSLNFIAHVRPIIHPTFRLMDDEQGLFSVRQQKRKADPLSCLEFCFHALYTHTPPEVWVDVAHFTYRKTCSCGFNTTATKCNMIMLHWERTTLSCLTFHYLPPTPLAEEIKRRWGSELTSLFHACCTLCTSYTVVDVKVPWRESFTDKTCGSTVIFTD
jgi:hypothetical protein